MAGRAGQSRQLARRGSSAVTAGFGCGLARPFAKRRSGKPAASAASPSRTFPCARATALECEWSQERMDPDGESAMHADLPDGPRERSSGVFESLQLAHSASLRLPGVAFPHGGERKSHTLLFSAAAERRRRALPGPSTLASDSRPEKWRLLALACHAAGRCILPGYKGVRETAISFDPRGREHSRRPSLRAVFFECLGCTCNQDNSSSRESARACRFWVAASPHSRDSSRCPYRSPDNGRRRPS